MYLGGDAYGKISPKGQRKECVNNQEKNRMAWLDYWKLSREKKLNVYCSYAR